MGRGVEFGSAWLIAPRRLAEWYMRAASPNPHRSCQCCDARLFSSEGNTPCCYLRNHNLITYHIHLLVMDPDSGIEVTDVEHDQNLEYDSDGDSAFVDSARRRGRRL